MVREVIPISASLATRTLIASVLILGIAGCSEKKPAGPPETSPAGATAAGGDSTAGGENANDGGATEGVDSAAQQQLR